MKTPYLLYDVFTDTPFGGNPLAIFTHGDDVAPEKMQAIARDDPNVDVCPSDRLRQRIHPKTI